MIDAIVTGRLHGKPSQKTAKPAACSSGTFFPSPGQQNHVLQVLQVLP